MSSRTSITAVIAVSILFYIAQTAFSQDMPEKTSRRGANRTQRSGEAINQRKTPTSGQRDAISVLVHRQVRKILVGNTEREFFIHIPEAIKGRPSPVVFVLHGGASSSGLAMHLKTDFTVLGKQQGYVTVHPSGVNGWLMQRGRSIEGTGASTRDIYAPDEFWGFLQKSGA